jgi:cellulose synthase/poly-beta-1,6-N-acetylglucosamine synthase-like glycosyltransferase
MITLALIYDIFRFGFFAVFTGLHAVLMMGLVLEWRRDRKCLRSKAAQSSDPQVSVIIPVHNETLRMEGLLRSLALQDYAKAEFIFVDDRSTDESARMIGDFIRERPAMRLISITENTALNRKQYALGKGIEVSSGEFILFTDADCEIPQGWISAMVKRMSGPKTGIALGPVFKKPGGRGFFHLYQCFEHSVRYMYLAASTGIGAAGGGFGNNMILRRASLDAIGGYSSVPPSPTEDAALVSKIRSSAGYKIRAAISADVHVITGPENNWKDFITQTLRWNNGGLFSPDCATRFNYGFLVITISMGILALPLLLFIPSLWPLSAAVMISMSANTIATLLLFGGSLPRKGAAYLFQLVFTPMYFTFLTILGLCGIRSKWKGNELK